jgi:adenosylhomocysteine nucleosidase
VSPLPGVCIVVAVHRETLGLRRRLLPWRRLSAFPFPAWVIGPDSALVVQSGVGVTAATRALSGLLDTGWRGAVVSAGFCGALVPDLQVGDLVRATEVLDTDGSLWTTTWPAGATVVARVGRVLTARELVGEPSVKKALGQCHDALAVEMEAAALAGLCVPRGLPFTCLRVVSDGLEDALSTDLVGLLGGGQVRFKRLTAALLRRPMLATELWRLGRVTRAGAERLGQALVELLAVWDR